MSALRLPLLFVAAAAAGFGTIAACGSDGTTTTTSSSSGGDASTTNASGTTSASTSASGTGGGSSTATTSTSAATTGTGGAGQGGSGQGGDGGSLPVPVVRFAAFGDAGKGNQGQQDVADAVAAKCAQDGCDFVQLLGDNIYDSGVDSVADAQWQTKFETPYQAISQEFWVVLGNHDYGGDGAGNEFSKGQNEIDYTGVSTKWKLPSAYYKRTLAHVEFFALDTNMAMYYQAGQQTTDISNWLAQSTATWRIAIGHHPYLSNGPHGNAGNYDNLPFIPIANGQGVKDILEDSVCGKADVYISGHDHVRNWMATTCSGTELIVSGAGASSTSLDGNGPTHFEDLSLGFLYVTIEGNSFTGEFINVDGTVAFSRTLTK